jgi:hypothetical protein
MIRKFLPPIALALFAVGCTESGKPGGDAKAAALEEKIQANLEKLPAEDRALAEQQKFCASETDQRLGSMGVPIKTSRYSFAAAGATRPC